MAHPQHQYAPRAYSPPRSTPSPHPGAYLPPSKRQRLSPNPTSPYTSPNLGNRPLPNQMFSSPNFGGAPNGNQQRPYTETAPAAPAGVMGPPSRPATVDKPTDVNDLSDVLAGSGVDLREEEAALINRHNNSTYQQNGIVFPLDSAVQFNPTNSIGMQAGNYAAYSNYNTMSANVPGDRGSFYGAGTFNQQPVVPIQSLEEQAETERKRAIRRRSERQQYHLNDPFLFGGTLQRCLSKHTHSMQVTVPRTGLLTSNNQSGQAIQLAVAGPDKHEVLVMVKGQDLLYHDTPLSEILTLLSLATQERIRTVVEDTATLAKGRRVGSHGLVPLDFADLATGNGVSDPMSAFITPDNSAVSPKENPLKRSFSESNTLPTPISEAEKTPSTIVIPNQLTQVLRQVIRSERSVEELRAAKRSGRNVNGILGGEASRSGSLSLGTPGSVTSGTLGERAPDIDAKKATSKKEQRRQAEAKATEAQQHATTNNTINMALGGKKLSWMTSKTAPASSSAFPGPPRVNTGASAQTRTANGAGGTGTGGSSAPGKKQVGDFREDKEDGSGIQMRDVVFVLEPEPKERKALARAYTRMNSKR